MISELNIVLKNLLLALTYAYFFISVGIFANELKQGEKLYNDNCAACHRVKSFTVGPSLVEISKKYSKEKEKSFLNWTNNPGKINPKTIQMPAMSHLGDPALKMVHKYVLHATKSVKETKSRHGFTPFKRPEPKYPYVKRSYMPFASPAAIAVVLNDQFSLSWDASIKRLRYGFSTANVFFSGESALDKAEKLILYKETSSQFWPFINDEQIEYQGYKLKDGTPTFMYQAGNIHITERIIQGPKVRSFVRQFTVKGSNSGAVIDLSHDGNVTIMPNKGVLERNQLTLTEKELAQFSITVTMND